jgi:hypothetical protein
VNADSAVNVTEFPNGFPMGFQWLPNGFPVVSQWFPVVFLIETLIFSHI